MSYHTQEAPASAARQVTHYFSLIANTLEWNHAAWQSLMLAWKALVRQSTPSHLPT